MTHPNVQLHQVAFHDGKTTTPEFIRIAHGLGVGWLTLVTPLLMAPGGMDGVGDALAETGVKVGTVNHPFSRTASLDKAGAAEVDELLQAIDITAELGGKAVYMLSGGRGSLDWEEAAQRFAELIAPAREAAKAKGITLLVENAGALNADFHIAHTLRDVTTLAEIAGISLCLDFQPCWFEAGIKDLIQRAIPNTGLIQISDYIYGDRTTPCRAVPGDGVVPIEKLIGYALDAGYKGKFDLELVGPRIREEGPLEASRRSVAALSAILDKLGA